MLLSRDSVADKLNELIAVPATRTIRGLRTEVALGPSDGMPVYCVLNFDHVSLAQRSRLGAVLEVVENLGAPLEQGPAEGLQLRQGAVGEAVCEASESLCGTPMALSPVERVRSPLACHRASKSG